MADKHILTDVKEEEDQYDDGVSTLTADEVIDVNFKLISQF